MKIGFISLMRGAAWGGSEALWSKTALLALAEGHAVESLTYDWHPRSPQLLHLQEAGVDTKFYQDDSRAVLDRLAVKLRLRQPRSRVVPAMSADVFVLSNGSVWDFIRHAPITDAIVALGKPYLFISHNTREFGENLSNADSAYAARVLEKAAQRLFVSERNRQGAERQLAAPLGACQVVTNPIDVVGAVIKPYPVSDELLLASVGSLTCGFKGQDLLLESLSNEVWQNRAFQLKIYGSGPDADYLHRLIALYQLEGKVSLEGHVSNVDRIWEANQALVLSSTSEGVPMVVAEAMLAGRPVLGTDVGAVARYVLEGQTGFLVPVANAKYLAEGLEKLWQSRATLAEMGRAAYQHAIAITETEPEKRFLTIIEAAFKAGAARP